VLAAVGVTQDDEEMGRAGRARRLARDDIADARSPLDVASFGISYNHPRIREMANGIELVMLPMDRGPPKGGRNDLGAAPCIVKASEYKFLPATRPRSVSA
jgi:hypothetical protein